MKEQLEKIKRLGKIARKDLLSIYDYDTNSNLSGLCGIATWHLMNLMKYENIYLKPRINYQHCWATWRNLIIDITATQFQKRNHVYIIKDITAKKYGWYEDNNPYPKHKLESSDDLLKIISNPQKWNVPLSLKDKTTLERLQTNDRIKYRNRKCTQPNAQERIIYGYS